MRMRQLIHKLAASVLGPDLDSSQKLRQDVSEFAASAARDGPNNSTSRLPNEVAPYVDKLTHAPYKIVDSDLRALVDAGYSEDAIFEITVAASFGSAVGRVERLDALLLENPA